MADRARLKHRTALRDVMNSQVMPVRVLADRAGCGKSMIGLLRTGTRTSCSAELAVKIAAALDVPTEELFTIEERSEDPEGAEPS
ncbi:helix-turn-helix transcriptional regulator [Nocardia sp. NPDC051787]|uniref:helix-turn-helix transcriptional regulator n=1 Tax=Nocardia sp. NPDC051787 TaxID=3155415 RepID=UPI003441C31B